jgi:3-hydroxyisobutyrate dehydrogenase
MSDSKTRVGFVGLGIMGGPMALNCIAAGFDVTVYNRTPDKAEPHRRAGAAVADSPADLARGCDVVLSCVTASDDVLEVLLDESSGVIAGARPGTVVIDCSTVDPEVAQKCSAALAERGVGFLDAPVSGGDVGAKAGTLSIMVGGRREHFDAALGVLEAMGKTITYCGQSGSGYTVKLCNQVCGALHLLAAAEAVSLARAAGVDPEAMLSAVSGGAAGSWMLQNLAPKMVSGDYEPGFFVDYQLKDLRLASDEAHRLGVPLPAAAMAEAMFRAASSQGLGRCGTQAVYRVIEALRSGQNREN